MINFKQELNQIKNKKINQGLIKIIRKMENEIIDIDAELFINSILEGKNE